MSYDEFLRGARAVIAPARRVAFHVVRRVFEDDAYADRAFAAAADELDARDRALSRSESPTAPCSGCERSTTGSTRSAAGPCASSTRP